MYVYDVFEKKQTLTTYSVGELMDMIQSNQIIIRETSAPHVRKIKKYIADNFISNTIYLPPIVARVVPPETLENGKPSTLYIIDGASRIKALTEFDSTILKLIQNDDEQEQRKGFMLKYRLKEMQLSIHIFEGLSDIEADQLYIDLNSKGKKVALSKRISYDSRNAINVATNHILSKHEGLKKAGVEVERASLIRPANKKFISLAQLRQIVLLFLTGKKGTSKRQGETSNEQELLLIYEAIHTWFDELFLLSAPEIIGNYHRSILASFPVVYALAQYACQGLGEVSVENQSQHIHQKMQAIKQINWDRNYDGWQQFSGSFRGKEGYYYINNNKKTIEHIVNWLCIEGGE